MGTRQQDSDEELSVALNSYREENGMNISQLSEALGFARPYVSRVLAGKKSPGVSFRHAARELISNNEARSVKPPNDSSSQFPALEHHLHHKVQELGERLMDLEGITSWNHLVTHLIKEEGLRQGLFGELEEIYGKRVTKGERLDFHHSQMDKAKSVFRRAQRVLEDAEREIARLEAGEPEEKIDVDMTKGKD